MLVTIIIVGLFVFKAPDYVWLSIPICFAYLFLKSAIKAGAGHKNNKRSHDDCPQTEYDEFDWWQDNQGL